ncbi:hypothetical protein [Parasedimentitalea huanghaiensis]|uniref:Uncharacterized protein n=1 Tax=Parasedimentitalea huanghaiensis TaxID=2682100 RepID=A0A6L6WGK4_9RHOB|nr:hypothetical protein [Zongyanglinia huanghaiensis]MVO14812.1 hypothetical protein [Zongyanglinia huanghaiensis]
MTQKVQMRALQSRTATQSPTGKALKPGDAYETTDQGARDDKQRGFGEPVTGQTKAKS